jgi:hypothetical protein
MPDCEICGAQRVKTYKCKECGVNFCVRCGKSHKNLCNKCLSKDVKSSPLSIITGLFGGKK